MKRGQAVQRNETGQKHQKARADFFPTRSKKKQKNTKEKDSEHGSLPVEYGRAKDNGVSDGGDQKRPPVNDNCDKCKKLSLIHI